MSENKPKPIPASEVYYSLGINPDELDRSELNDARCSAKLAEYIPVDT